MSEAPKWFIDTEPYCSWCDQYFDWHDECSQEDPLCESCSKISINKMKTALILVLSGDWHPYNSLMKCSMETWDSIEQEGCETIYYISGKSRIEGKVLYVPTGKDLYSLGHKTIAALEWAINNKEFDYIVRPGANCYIDKKGLIKHIQSLPVDNVFCTLEVIATATARRWGWGLGTIFSKDVVQKIIDNKNKWQHNQMEDVAMSYLIDDLGIPYTSAVTASIDKIPGGWRCMAYGTEGFEFTDFSIFKERREQFWFRCKQDYDRTKDEYVMKELFKNFNP